MQSWEDVQRFPYDFKDIEARPDVVTFTSAPLAEVLTVAGLIEGPLQAESFKIDVHNIRCNLNCRIVFIGTVRSQLGRVQLWIPDYPEFALLDGIDERALNQP